MSGSHIDNENLLDDLLATLQRGSLSTLELRILLQLAERDATQAILAAALDTEPKAIDRATRRLAMRGLIGRRFEERGRASHFVLSIGKAGLLELAPLVGRVAKTHPTGKGNLIFARGVSSPPGPGRVEGHGHVDDRLKRSAGRGPSLCRALR